MAEKVTLEIPDDVASQARTVAARTQRSFDAVLVDWLSRAGSEPLLELLPDEDLLAICDEEPDAIQQEELSDLLDINREGLLTVQQRERLDSLMQLYRAGLVRKAQALKVAIGRGIRSRLS